MLCLVGTMAILARQIRSERELNERLDCLAERVEARAASVDAMMWMADVKSDDRHSELTEALAEIGRHVDRQIEPGHVTRHAQAS
jgi:hypothetical protein